MLPHSDRFNFLFTVLSRQSHIVVFCLPNISFYDFFITCYFEIVLFKHLTYKRARYHLIFHGQQRWIPRLPPTLRLLLLLPHLQRRGLLFLSYRHQRQQGAKTCIIIPQT